MAQSTREGGVKGRVQGGRGRLAGLAQRYFPFYVIFLKVFLQDLATVCVNGKA